MPTLQTLTEADIKKVVNSRSRQRANKYVGRVLSPVRRGNTLTAQVPGTRLYQVEIDVLPGGIYATCSCPYDWGGYCKHICAVLLKWLRAPDAFTVEQEESWGKIGRLEVTFVEPPPPQQPEEEPSWLTRSFTTRHREDRQVTHEWLEQLKVSELRELAKQNGWKVKGTRKDNIIDQIITELEKPAVIQRLVNSLDEEHRQVLRALATRGGEMGATGSEIERVALFWGALEKYKQIMTYVGHLAETGLVISVDHLRENYLVDAFIPLTVLRQCPPLLADVVAAGDPLPKSETSELRLAAPQVLLRTVNQLILMAEREAPALRPPMPRPRLEKYYSSLAGWDYEAQEVLEIQQSGEQAHYSSDRTLTVPPPPLPLVDDAMARLAPVAGDETRLDFLYHLLVAGGIFQPGSPVTVWPQVKERYLRLDEGAQRATLARLYFFMDDWSEWWPVARTHPEVKLKRYWQHHYFKPEHLLNELTAFRNLVLRVLSLLPDGQWLALAELWPLLRTVWPDFSSSFWEYRQYRASAKPRWFLAQNGRQLKTNDWSLAQKQFISQMITGPLHWLGLVDLALEEGEPVALRPQGLADLYLDRVDVLPLSPEAAVSPTATTEAVATAATVTVDPSTISAQAHALLERIASLEEAVPGRFVYRLDIAAVYTTFESGYSLQQLQDDWQRLLPMPMPPAMQEQFSAWWQKYGQVRIYEEVTVIEFGDEYALAEMKATTSLEQHLIAEISPRLVMIPQQAVETLAAELEKAGYTPKKAGGLRELNDE